MQDKTGYTVKRKVIPLIEKWYCFSFDRRIKMPQKNKNAYNINGFM